MTDVLKQYRLAGETFGNGSMCLRIFAQGLISQLGLHRVADLDLKGGTAAGNLRDLIFDSDKSLKGWGVNDRDIEVVNSVVRGMIDQGLINL